MNEIVVSFGFLLLSLSGPAAIVVEYIHTPSFEEAIKSPPHSPEEDIESDLQLQRHRLIVLSAFSVTGALFVTAGLIFL